MKELEKIHDLDKRIFSIMSELTAQNQRVEVENREPTAEERSWALDQMKKVEELHASKEVVEQELELRQKLNKTARQPIPPQVEDSRQEKYPGLPPKDMRFATLGEQMCSIARAADNSHGVDRRLMRAATGMGESAAPTLANDGGFLVQIDFATQIIEKVMQASPLVAAVSKIPIGANSNSMVFNAIAESSRESSIWGGIALNWLGEGDQKTPSTPVFRQMQLVLKKIAGLWYATDELLQDAAALGAFSQRGFSQALALALENVIIRGNGTTQPDGILGHASTVVVTPNGGNLDATDIINMWARLYAPSMPNSIWLYNQGLLPQLMTLEIGDYPVWMAPNGLAGGVNGTILGRPAYPIPCAGPVGFEGDLMLVDPAQYLMIDKGGVQFGSSIHVRFQYDETCFRLVYRCDGRPAWEGTLTPPDGGDPQSPFVVLGDRDTT